MAEDRNAFNVMGCELEDNGWRPSSGVAEDRNSSVGIKGPEALKWRPSSGVAEDRNLNQKRDEIIADYGWRPSSGVAEDRNTSR